MDSASEAQCATSYSSRTDLVHSTANLRVFLQDLAKAYARRMVRLGNRFSANSSCPVSPYLGQEIFLIHLLALRHCFGDQIAS